MTQPFRYADIQFVDIASLKTILATEDDAKIS